MATPRNARPGMLLDPGAPINNGLVGWWPMWEGAGGKTLDISGKNNHGTLTNGPTWGGGEGLSFDGSDDVVQVSSNASLKVQDHAFAAWVYSTNNAGDRMLGGKSTSIFSAGIEWATSNGTLEYAFFSGGAARGWYVGTGATVPLNAWAHFAFVAKPTAGLVEFYINGRFIISVATYVGSITHDDTFFQLADAHLSNPNFAGRMKGARLFSRAISALEVQQLYVNPNIGLWVPDTIRYYIPAAGGGFQPAWAANSNVLLGGGMAL